jgi:hypothetical protein
MLVQGTLPGFARPGGSPRRRRWRDDAALSESRARADRRYADWRAAFVSFLRRQPPDRRAELRRRLRPTPSAPRREHVIRAAA